MSEKESESAQRDKEERASVRPRKTHSSSICQRAAIQRSVDRGVDSSMALSGSEERMFHRARGRKRIKEKAHVSE